MGKTSDNLFADGFSGKMGRNMVFRQKKSGKVIVAKSPKKTRRKVKDISRQIRKTFKDAVDYAKSILRNPANASLKADYEAAAKGDQSGYNVALRDYCKSPIVNKIITSEYKGVVGDRITIDAEDDFKVAEVTVVIHSATGDLIEQGTAVSSEIGNKWEYAVTVANASLAGTKISATAIDFPGNTGLLEVTL